MKVIHMRNTHYDLIIAGAGFAGLSAAHTASVRGLKVAVLDKKPDPGSHIHTTGLIVKELADQWDIPRHLTRKIHGIRLYSPNLNHIDLESPGYYFLATDTAGILRQLALKAWSTGSQIISNTPVNHLHHTTNQIEINNATYTSRFLIGADGARSTVAKLSGFSQNHKFLSGVEVAMENIKGIHEDRLHVFLDASIAKGYIAWVVPGVNNTYQIGLASKLPHKPDLNAFLKILANTFDLTQAKELHRRGGLIPIGGTLRNFYNHNTMLLGDAAGMVSPLTAGGIHPAVHLGKLAGVATSNHLIDQDIHPAKIVAQHASAYRYKRLMRTTFDLTSHNTLYNIMLQNKLTKALAKTIFFHHRGLFSYNAWRDILKTCITLQPQNKTSII